MNKDVGVIGDVVVNQPSFGPTLDEGVELSIDRLAVVDGKAAAVRIVLDRDAAITGDVATDSLDNRGGTIGGAITPFAPPFAGLPTFQQAVVRSGAQDVVVADGATVTLPAGDYGHVTIEQNGTLVLSGGIYNVLSVTEATAVPGPCPFPCRVVAFSAPSDLRVAGRFDTGKSSFVGADGAAPSDVVIYVAGENGGDGSPGALPSAFAMGQDSVLEATVYAVRGTVRLDRSSIVTGALVGRDVRLDVASRLTAASYFRNRPPVADPQTLATQGAVPLGILLTGSDPEAGDLTFSIAVGPEHGTLSSLVPVVPDPVPVIDPDTGLPTGELVQPPITSATVTYTPASADNLTDSFTFEVTDPCGATGTANVLVNAGACDDGSPPPCDPPPPVATVEALDVSAETLRDTPVIVSLRADAPCDGACDGLGGDVPLTFAIVGGVPFTTAHGGTVDGLVQGSENPRRTAAVTYTPAPGFVSLPLDGFDFEACGTIGGVEVCDVATVTIEVARAPSLAEDVTATADVNSPIPITLIGNSGGVGDEGKASPSVPLAALKAIAIQEANAFGAVTDVDFDGLGDQVVTGETLTVDFETPALGVEETRRTIDPYTSDGVVFTADGTCSGFSGEVGLVQNVGSGTSACVPPASSDQKLATGPLGSASVGLSGFAIRATFPSPLPAGSEVGAQVQTGSGVPIRMRLFDAQDQEVGSASGVASPAVGVCAGNVGVDRARATVTAAAAGTVAYAVVDLAASTCGSVFVIDDFTFTAAESVQAARGEGGETRVQIEWDVSNVPATSLVSARVILETVKGESDSLDTFFFAGDGEQDAAVTPPDFEAPASPVAGAVMPVPDVPAGTVGTFTFDVLTPLLAALQRDVPLDVFSIQGRVDLQAVGEGLRIRTSPPPFLEWSTPPPIFEPPLVFTVLSAPLLGTLLDSGGQPVVVGVPLASPNLTYVSGALAGIETISYRVEQAGIIGTAVLVITVSDGCVEVGRPPGCSPSP